MHKYCLINILPLKRYYCENLYLFILFSDQWRVVYAWAMMEVQLLKKRNKRRKKGRRILFFITANRRRSWINNNNKSTDDDGLAFLRVTVSFMRYLFSINRIRKEVFINSMAYNSKLSKTCWQLVRFNIKGA